MDQGTFQIIHVSALDLYGNGPLQNTLCYSCRISSSLSEAYHYEPIPEYCKSGHQNGHSGTCTTMSNLYAFLGFPGLLINDDYSAKLLEIQQGMYRKMGENLSPLRLSHHE